MIVVKFFLEKLQPKVVKYSSNLKIESKTPSRHYHQEATIFLLHLS